MLFFSRFAFIFERRHYYKFSSAIFSNVNTLLHIAVAIEPALYISHYMYCITIKNCLYFRRICVAADGKGTIFFYLNYLFWCLNLSSEIVKPHWCSSWFSSDCEVKDHDAKSNYAVIRFLCLTKMAHFCCLRYRNCTQR